MAKIKLGNQGYLDDDPYPGPFDVTLNGKHTKAVYVDEETDAKIIFKGDNLKIGGEHDLLRKGTVEKALLMDDDGNVLMSVKGEFKAALIGKGMSFGTEGLTLCFLRGNDKVVGGTGDDRVYGLGGNDRLKGGLGDDELAGHKGKDIMTGNGGEDIFHFAMGWGKDRVTDFTDGEDLLSVTAPGISSYDDLEGLITQHGDDTWIVLSRKHVLILDNVDRATIDQDDFTFDIR